MDGNYVYFILFIFFIVWGPISKIISFSIILFKSLKFALPSIDCETAKSKGISRSNILIKHALPNALNPVITAISGWFASLLAGAFFVEYIFNWRGLGKLTIEALEMNDLPVVMGSILFIGLFQEDNQ